MKFAINPSQLRWPRRPQGWINGSCLCFSRCIRGRGANAKQTAEDDANGDSKASTGARHEDRRQDGGRTASSRRSIHYFDSNQTRKRWKSFASLLRRFDRRTGNSHHEARFYPASDRGRLPAYKKSKRNGKLNAQRRHLYCRGTGQRHRPSTDGGQTNGTMGPGASNMEQEGDR